MLKKQDKEKVIEITEKIKKRYPLYNILIQCYMKKNHVFCLCKSSKIIDTAIKRSYQKYVNQKIVIHDIIKCKRCDVTILGKQSTIKNIFNDLKKTDT